MKRLHDPAVVADIRARLATLQYKHLDHHRRQFGA